MLRGGSETCFSKFPFDMVLRITKPTKIQNHNNVTVLENCPPFSSTFSLPCHFVTPCLKTRFIIETHVRFFVLLVGFV